MKIRALAITAALALPTLAIADTTTPKAAATEKTAKLTSDEIKIVAHLHHVNQMEIDMGKWAQKTGTATVKGYGETLINDHTSADKDLTAFAKKRGLSSIPADKPTTDAERQDEKDMTIAMAKLKTLKGAEFDKEFLTMMTKDHDKELTKIDAAMGTVTDSELKAMLTTVKPVLQRHSDQARDLQKNAPQASAAPDAPKPR